MTCGSELVFSEPVWADHCSLTISPSSAAAPVPRVGVLTGHRSLGEGRCLPLAQCRPVGVGVVPPGAFVDVLAGPGARGLDRQRERLAQPALAHVDQVAQPGAGLVLGQGRDERRLSTDPPPASQTNKGIVSRAATT